jgi:thiamine biosynthesis lipoprotein
MKVQHRQIQSMGTRLDLVLAGVEPERCDAIAREVKAECDRIEGLISIYRSDSVVSVLNQKAHTGTFELDQELHHIFSEIIELHGETGGYFDVTLKPVSDYFRDHEGQILPLLEKIREKVGMDKMILEPGGIRFYSKGVTIDLGGYGKGFAVKRMLPILESYQVDHALISFGESLVYGWGTHPYGETWRVAVPVEEGDEPANFDLKNEALSTSGNSLNNQKKFAYSGHIVNPVTLQMVTQRGLVSVKSSDPVRAEVFSTALFSAGPERTGEILQHTTDLEIRWMVQDDS